MENAKVDKKLVFDKILVNTFNKCVGSLDFQEANKILSTDLISFYNSTYNYAVPIYAEEYNFKSAPTFNEKEKQILDLFYGVKINLLNLIYLIFRKDIFLMKEKKLT